MRIRMVQERTGPRWDERAWPPVGGEIDVSDEEGAAVCGAGWAVPVPSGRAAQTPEDSLAATEETRSAPQVPAPGAPKTAWVDYAAALGHDRDEAAAMTKSDLIAALGGHDEK